MRCAKCSLSAGAACNGCNAAELIVMANRAVCNMRGLAGGWRLLAPLAAEAQLERVDLGAQRLDDREQLLMHAEPAGAERRCGLCVEKLSRQGLGPGDAGTPSPPSANILSY